LNLNKAVVAEGEWGESLHKHLDLLSNDANFYIRYLPPCRCCCLDLELSTQVHIN
jgi:hypothetical protein